MKQILATVDVDATPEAVWAVLTDLDAYAEWNPQTTRASGVVAEGETVELHLAPEASRGGTLRAKVTAAEVPRRLE